jgi:catechol 2,3-dioxygenase-like lactoylglutathione lyase family enzyme
MFSHIFVGINDFARAERFYDAVMRSLNLEKRWADASRPWAGWQGPLGRPYFVIAHPHDGGAPTPGNGLMVAFAASSREAVRLSHAAAIANGGTCEGPPGLRPQYHEHYYGAYFRDPDGNKLAVACHAALGDD